MSKVNHKTKEYKFLFYVHFRHVAKQFLEQIGTISNDGNIIKLHNK